ncbi:asparagine synthase (glutamine-hydrolyzing) [Pyruvatibacter sp.]|uniref:asparagine synthase (glutamine-hydrolyzing) n=1 Tax=Pyruvatibacter sp. TaxID=1981328 RepID=UPI0032ED2AA4
MCGIAGVQTTSGQSPSAAALNAMSQALAHRGPDGEGSFISGATGLIQTRLAIIDLETGDQPLFDDEGLALVANGEIYNYLELRREFGEANFSTHSDCETPLKLYRRDGMRFADGLRGMYAIAMYDPDGERLLLARDPFGIKPLYYAETTDGFVFASEPQAILATGLVEPKLDISAAGQLLQLQFTTGRSTAFVGINRVLPGETLLIERGRILERYRRDALPKGAPVAVNEERAMVMLEDALIDSVRVHQRSDVPYGMFLSGGIDSSVILACMARLNDQPVRCYTAGFSGTHVQDEREHAARVASATGADHVSIDVTEDDFWSLLPAMAAAVDDPTADYAIIPTFKLAAVAAQDVKVVLCGEGGDELFAGYGRYRAITRPTWLGGRAMRARGSLDGLHLLHTETPDWRDGISAAWNRAGGGHTRLQRAQAVDCADWLPNDLLIKLDRCLMAHSLEGRTPLLDPAVAQVAFALPDALKLKGRTGKYLLRAWLAKHLPEAEPFARKRGFTVPVGEWIARRGQQLAPLVAMQPGVAELCKIDRVRALFAGLGTRPAKREGQAAWLLLYYALWHQHHILRHSVEGTVEEVLSVR